MVDNQLPVVFEEEKSYGVKSNSSIQYELNGKLSSENKAALLDYAKSQTPLYVSRRQVGDLYELKAGEYIMVIDSSGDNDRIHLRTSNGNFAPVGIFGGLVSAAVSFFATVNYPISWRSFGIPFIIFSASTLLYTFSQNSLMGTVRKQENKMLEMIAKIDEVHAASLTTAPSLIP